MSSALVATYEQLRDDPELLQQITGHTSDSLRIQKQLRKTHAEALVRLAVQQVQLRKQAAGKFPGAESMWFTSQGLEQSSAHAVSQHKSARFPTGQRVWDLCCGIGGDSLSLIQRGPVLAVDRDELHCRLTDWNCQLAVDRSSQPASPPQIVCGDVRSLSLSGKWVHLDPDRRAGGRGRALRLENYEPDLEFLQALTHTARGGALKLGPASNFVGKFPGCEIELVSLDGECKEATVWFGELAEAGEVRRATVLPQNESLVADPLSVWPAMGALSEYLYDPDPAVVRSTLVDVLADRLSLQRLDAEEEYLTADKLVDSAFVRAFRVEANLPNNDRQIRQYFREHSFGDVEIKCRHVPIDAQRIRRRLTLSGGPRASLIFARVASRVRAIVARRVDQPAA